MGTNGEPATMGTGGGRNPKNCEGVAKDTIQAAEVACYGSLQNCHTDCNKRDKSVMVDTTRINYYLYRYYCT